MVAGGFAMYGARPSEATRQYSLLAGLNTLWPGQDGRHFAYNIFKCIFLTENALIPIKISLVFIPNGPINN